MSAPAGTVGCMTDLRDQGLAILRRLTGDPAADFHPDQWEAIEALVADHRRALVVERTGWGKSAVYFVAALLQRRAGRGPALIVSPLLALMRDQVAAAERAGVRAASISSANVTEWDQIRTQLADNSLDVLLVSPERLVNPRFAAEQLPELTARMGMLVIDEAHCISDWGHDFRPDYRRIRDLVAALPAGVPVLATTATANSRVVTDIAEQIAADPRQQAQGQQVFVVRGPLARDSLRLGVLDLPRPELRLAWLCSHLGEFRGSGIIYCLTISAAEDTARALTEAGHHVLAYTGRTDTEERADLEEQLKDNRVKARGGPPPRGRGLAQPARGVVHHPGAPPPPGAADPQVGRAGRATDSADVLLLPGPEDRDIWHYFATSAMPTAERADAVLASLPTDLTLSTAALEARVDIRRSPLELLLKVLAVDGAVERVAGGWRSTGQGWVYDAQRYARIAAARAAEQEAMERYEHLDSCRMAFLTGQLDDPDQTPCGRCDVCAGPWYPTSVDPDQQDRARRALDRVGVPVDPRRSWPTGLDRLGVDLRGRIPAGEQAAEGRVIARLSDLGWGGPLRELLGTDSQGDPIDAEVPAGLAGACLRVLAEWGWQRRPAAVVSIPSVSRPVLVDSLARGIARAGRLTDLGSLDLAPDAGPLDSHVNSAFRLRDVAGRFRVGDQLTAGLRELSGAPVLLVDDVIISRWTVTVAARMLRRAGSGEVLPLALALGS